MKIYIKAKPKSKKEYVKKIDDTHYVIAVKEPPVAGKANQAIIKSLAKYFNKSSSQVYLFSGMTSRQKVFAVPLTKEEIESSDNQKKLL